MYLLSLNRSVYKKSLYSNFLPEKNAKNWTHFFVVFLRDKKFLLFDVRRPCAMLVSSIALSFTVIRFWNYNSKSFVGFRQNYHKMGTYRKRVKTKGKRWIKGQSSNSNPTKSTFRKAAGNNFFVENLDGKWLLVYFASHIQRYSPIDTLQLHCRRS